MPLQLRTFWHWLQRRLNRTSGAHRKPVKVMSVRPIPDLVLNMGSRPSPNLATTEISLPSAQPEPARVVSCRVLPSTQDAPPDEKPPSSRHIERSQLLVHSFAPHDPLQTAEETWERRGNSFHTTQSRSLVLTPGNMLVPPDAVQGFCSDCGGPDHALYTCARTGVALCPACVRFFPLHGEPVPISRHVARELQERLSSWERHDFETGLATPEAFLRVFPFHRSSHSL